MCALCPVCRARVCERQWTSVSNLILNYLRGLRGRFKIVFFVFRISSENQKQLKNHYCRVFSVLFSVLKNALDLRVYLSTCFTDRGFTSVSCHTVSHVTLTSPCFNLPPLASLCRVTSHARCEPICCHAVHLAPKRVFSVARANVRAGSFCIRIFVV